MRAGTYQAAEKTKLFAAAAETLPFINHKNQPGINHPQAKVTAAGAKGCAAGLRFHDARSELRAIGNGIA